MQSDGKTPRDDRATAREGRRGHLEVPSSGLGRADLIRSRSPSPSATAPGAFQFPPQQLPQPETEQFADALASTSNSNMPDLSVDDIVKIATASAKAAAQEMAATLRAPAADPDAPAAAAATTSANNHIKKVELPSFDKKNIHTWIRRVEAAFGRAGVVTPNDKFFFIESKLDVNLNPKINEYLCGESTEEKWDEFLEYLQNEYGRTKEQQAALFLNGIPREGLRPTQHLAKIKDLTKDIGLDDLLKEMVLKDLPKGIKQSLAERTTLTAEEAANAADHYFDKDGRPKHENSAANVNNVDDVPGLVDTEDEGEQINAIQRGKFRGAQSYRGKQRQFRPQQAQQKAFTPAFSNPPANNYRKPQGQSKNSSLQQICRFHRNFGDKAFNCEPGCQFKTKPQQGGNPTGNGQAGRRT